MNGEIICVGTELLLGNIVNTNARFLSEELAALGVNVYNQSVVGDNDLRIKQSLNDAMRRSQLIVLTGGLGPTDDDLTKESVASHLGLPLIEDPHSRKHIEEYFKRTERVAPLSNYKQSMMPAGCHIFKNDIGTAPGCAVKNGGCTIIILPGPPREMEYMFTKYVKPYISNMTKETIVSHNVRIFGEMESSIEEKIRQYTKLQNPTTAIYASEGEVTLRVTAKAASEAIADNLCTPVISALRETMGDSVYGVDCDNLQSVVVELLKEKKLKVATAESCTAGMLSSMITEVAGSSSVFDFGISAYANRIKINALGVPESVIDKYGAVSEHTAAYMAIGVRKAADSDLGIGITGVAGPGASENKPVGLVYVALADKQNIWIRKMTLGHGGSEREKIRRNSAKTALDLLRRYLCALPEVLEGSFAIGDSPSVLTAQPNITKVAAPTKAPVHTFASQENALSDSEIADLINAVAENDEYDASGYESAYFIEEQAGYIATGDEETKKPRFSIPRPKRDTKDYVEEEKKEENKTVRIRNYIISLIPWKGDTVREIIRKLIFIVSILALIASSVYIVNYFRESNKQTGIVEDVRELYSKEKSSTQKNESGIFVSFEQIIAQNSDTKAWINIPSTKVDNPVVQSSDNEYYLKRNFNKIKSRYGTLYFEAAATISPEHTSQNLVIYGHEMRDGSMFGTLKKFKNVNFYKENPVFKMRTLYDDAKYKIFAIFITNASGEQNNGTVFEYRTPDFASQSDFLSFVAQVKERSIINTGVDVVAGDKIVTLSTCTGEFEDARLVVVARRVRTGEYSTIDESLVSVNGNPRYPQAYYDKRGISNPFKDVPEIIVQAEEPLGDGFTEEVPPADTPIDTPIDAPIDTPVDTPTDTPSVVPEEDYAYVSSEDFVDETLESLPFDATENGEIEVPVN